MASRLSQMQARFQQKQMQEKEEKMLKFYENQQQRAFERVGRSSAGSNSSLTTTTTTISHGKVRQLFDERRQKAGIDRSYPLEPITTNRNGNRAVSLDRNGRKEKERKTTNTTTVQKTIRNGKPVLNKREVVNSVYYNNNGDEDSYEERFVDNGEGYLRRDNGDSNRRRDDTDLVDMMNRNNLNDSLDDEEMPHIGFDDYEEGIFTGKLANVGGKLPSETIVVEKEKKPPVKPAPARAVNGVNRTSTINGRSKVPTTNSVKTTNPSPKKEIKPAVRTVTSNSSSPSSSATSRGSPARKPSSASSAGSGSLPTTPVKSLSKPSSTGSTRLSPSATKPRTATPKAAPNVNDDNDGLSTCKNCQRRFASDRLAVHEKICLKTSKKKRKIYDATKHRFAGTDIEPYVKKSTKPGATSKNAAQTETTKAANKKPAAAAASKGNWRQKHEEFINAIRAAKQAQVHIANGGDIRDLPPPPPSTNPDYVQCPHCNRRFNEGAASRHIPKCQNFKFNKPKPNAKSKQPVKNLRSNK